MAGPGRLELLRGLNRDSDDSEPYDALEPQWPAGGVCRPAWAAGHALAPSPPGPDSDESRRSGSPAQYQAQGPRYPSLGSEPRPPLRRVVVAASESHLLIRMLAPAHHELSAHDHSQVVADQTWIYFLSLRLRASLATGPGPGVPGSTVI